MHRIYKYKIDFIFSVKMADMTNLTKDVKSNFEPDSTQSVLILIFKPQKLPG